MTPFHLRAVLDPAHSGDVKAVLCISDHTLATASRDGSVAIWAATEEQVFQPKALLAGHGAYVNSLCHLPPTGDGQDDYIVSGGNSSLILIHSLTTLNPDPVTCLVGHALNVCTLAKGQSSNTIISGSWDHTARVWSKDGEEWTCKLVLAGHEEAVWGVAIVDNDPSVSYLTGSADNLVAMWNSKGEQLMRMKGHPAPVRSLAYIPEEKIFASACNDGLIRIGDLNGNVIGNLKGHTDYVYQVVRTKRHSLISCGEDHTARLWDDKGAEEATLLHPCQTVWSVDMLPNGDIVTGGSDGRVRLWSASETRKAVPEILKAHEEEVARAIGQKDAPVATDKADDPGVLEIDVDVSDDSPPLKLKFQKDGDPRTAAQDFVEENQLPATYIDRIEDFIRVHSV